MYDVKKEISDYLNYYVNPNEKEHFLKAKHIVENEYFPEKGLPKNRLAVAKKAISDFSKLKPSPELEAELLIFLVEVGCRFTYEYGDMWEGFYDSMATNFERALKFMKKHDLLEKFQPNAERCVEWASPCGYGFADEIDSFFWEYYNDE
jgi:hypothetical protein